MDKETIEILLSVGFTEEHLRLLKDSLLERIGKNYEDTKESM